MPFCSSVSNCLFKFKVLFYLLGPGRTIWLKYLYHCLLGVVHFPCSVEKMCWPALCIWVIVFILITWVPVEGDWVIWPVLFLTISCFHSLPFAKSLVRQQQVFGDHLSWNLHVKSSLLKGGVRNHKDKHTVLPNAEIPLSQLDSRMLEKTAKHVLAVVQVLFLNTDIHRNIHVFLITWSILSSAHALLTSFIRHNHWIFTVCQSVSKQAKPPLTEATV